jgi:hypothetical protein
MRQSQDQPLVLDRQLVAAARLGFVQASDDGRHFASGRKDPGGERERLAPLPFADAGDFDVGLSVAEQGTAELAADPGGVAL